MKIMYAGMPRWRLWKRKVLLGTNWLPPKTQFPKIPFVGHEPLPKKNVASSLTSETNGLAMIQRQDCG
jgi:hypothetical protein